MADWHCVVSAGGIQKAWRDPDGTSAPSRLAFDAKRPPTYRSSPGGGLVSVSAVVGGVVGPVDGTLGGRLFTWSWGEWSGSFPPPIVQPTVGTSSVVQVTFDGVLHLGHQVLTASRKSADGSQYVNFHVHLDVE